MLVVVGKVLRAHGLRGDVLVDVRTDEPELRFGGGSVLRHGADLLTVASSAPHGGRMRVRFDGVTDREAAEALRGATLSVETGELPRSDDPDDFHDAELIGLRALTAAGEEIGTVTDVLHPARGVGPKGRGAGIAQDMLVIDRGEAGEALVPFVAALVPQVDLDAGVLVVDAPPGLLDSGVDGEE